MERFVKISFVIGLVVYFLISVVARTPAEWGTKAAIDAVPNLKLGGVSGTLWKGKASSAMIKIQGQIIDFGGLAWDVDTQALLSLSVCADIKSGLIEARVCRTLGGINSVQNLIVEQVPAKMINHVLGMAKIEGSFSLTVKNAELDDKGVVSKMDGTLLWDGARGDAGGGWFDLGSYMVEITENGSGGISANLTDTSGQFELALKGEYTVGQEPTFSGLIMPRPDAPIQIVDSLGFLSEALDDGSFRVKWPM